MILDEAHSIKDRRSNTAKAVFALSSRHKWALSGTPLQNRVAELYSQIRFLEVTPSNTENRNAGTQNAGSRSTASDW